MTQVNLLPPEVQQRQRIRRHTLLIASGAAAVVGLLFFMFILQQARLTKVSNDLAVQEQTNSKLRGEISQLQPFRQIQEEVSAKEALVAGTQDGRLLWSGVLRDISMVIPGDMWLTSLTGSVGTNAAPVPVTGSPTVGPVLVGSLQFQGVSFSRPVIASWLTNLEDVTGWVNPWISTATKAGGEGDQPEFTFSGSVDLTLEATETGGRS